MILPDIVAIGIYNSQKSMRNTEISRNRKTTMFEIELPVVSGGCRSKFPPGGDQTAVDVLYPLGLDLYRGYGSRLDRPV